MRERLQRALLPAILLGMQACWLYAWLSLVVAKTATPASIAPAIILFFAAAALARTSLRRLPLSGAFRISAFWLVWFVLAAIAGKLLLFPLMPWGQPDWVFALPRGAIRLLFETQPAQLLLLLGSGCAWYLGGRAISRGPTWETILGHFQFGLVLLLGAFLVAQGLDVTTSHPALLALAFFSLSLSGIAVARRRQEGTTGPQPAGSQFTGSLVTLVIVVAALGLLAGIIVTPGLIEVLVDAVRFVGHAVGSALLYILSLLPQPDLTPPEGDTPQPATGDDSGLLEFYRTFPWPLVLKRALFIIWVVVIMGMFILALWRVCSMVLAWLKRRNNMTGVEVESLSSGFLADLLALMLWFERTVNATVTRVTRFLHARLTPGGIPTYNSVYLNFVHWAGKKIRAREPSQSAHEYEMTLSALLPSAASDLAFITDTYARARYGKHEPDATALQEMQSAVQRIRTAPRRPQSKITITLAEGAQ